VLERATVPTSVEAFEQYFARHAPRLVALETGTHSPWASRAVAGAGHEVVVANARQLPLIYGVTHKSDVSTPVWSWTWRFQVINATPGLPTT
jgi:transposase